MYSSMKSVATAKVSIPMTVLGGLQLPSKIEVSFIDFCGFQYR